MGCCRKTPATPKSVNRVAQPIKTQTQPVRPIRLTVVAPVNRAAACHCGGMLQAVNINGREVLRCGRCGSISHSMT